MKVVVKKVLAGKPKKVNARLADPEKHLNYLIEKNRKELYSLSNGKYIKPAILEALDYILTNSKPNRISYSKKMMASKIKFGKVYTRVTDRMAHQQQASKIAGIIAEKLNLNVDLVKVATSYHDIGHCFGGHGGEGICSEITEDYGIGYVCHNAVGLEVIDKEKINEKVLEIAREMDKSVNEDEVDEAIMIVKDAILCHNGEGTEDSITPNFKKTAKKIEEDYRNCFIYKKYDKTLVPKTLEAAVLKFSDIIAYSASDFLDGVRLKIIKTKELPESYIDIFKRMDIPEKNISDMKPNERKDIIAEMMTKKFIDDIIINSTKNKIGLSKEMAKILYDLRNVDYNEIVKKCGTEYYFVYLPKGVRELHKILAQEIMKSDEFATFLKDVEDNTNYNTEYSSRCNINYEKDDDCDNYTQKVIYSFGDDRMTIEEKKEFASLVKDSLDASIEEEIKMAIALTTTSENERKSIFDGDENQLKRLKGELSLNSSDESYSIKKSRIRKFRDDIVKEIAKNSKSPYKRKYNETIKAYRDRVIEEYKPKIMKEIYMPREESEKKLFEKIEDNVKNNFPLLKEETQKKKIQKEFMKNYETNRLITFEELLAISLASRYIRGSDDEYMKDMLVSFGILTREQTNANGFYENKFLKQLQEAQQVALNSK